MENNWFFLYMSLYEIDQLVRQNIFLDHAVHLDCYLALGSMYPIQYTM
jgi:hypothetical protein